MNINDRFFGIIYKQLIQVMHISINSDAIYGYHFSLLARPTLRGAGVAKQCTTGERELYIFVTI